MSKWYDRMVAPVDKPFMAPSRPWVGQRARGKVLEVGAGTGQNFRHYTDAVTELTANDIDDGMLATAREVAAEIGRDVEYHVGSATDLPFPDDTFDSVVATFTLCGFRDHRAGLREMLRVLKPGGSLLLADHVGPPNRVLYAGLWLLERITKPLFSEHWTRRPLRELQQMGVEIVETNSRALGIIENVHARAR